MTEGLQTSAILNRFMPPKWEEELGLTLPIVDRHFDKEREQHPARRWEYSMALLALKVWEAGGWRPGYPVRTMMDVGGAGSPFHHMLKEQESPAYRVKVIDPDAGTPDIEQYVQRMRSDDFIDAVFSISVLEHVKGVPHFLNACCQVLQPGGLFFLTVDAWDPPASAEGQDKAHFNWMRERIYTPHLIQATVQAILRMGFQMLGQADWGWRGPMVYDYSFHSLAFVKGKKATGLPVADLHTVG